MKIILDTSVIRKDRIFSKNDMLFLIKLSKLELVDIYVPWVVYNESLSQNKNDILAEINKAIKIISGLGGKGLFGEANANISKIISELNGLIESVDNSVNSNWNSFIKDADVEIVDILDTDGKEVMTSYFTGAPPFPSAKSRKDIPDAFIFMSIKSLIKRFDDLHFICADNNLRVQSSYLNECTGYPSLKDFFHSDVFKPIEERYKEIEGYASELIDIKDNLEIIEEKIIENVYGDMFAGNNQSVSNYNILSEENEGAIQSISDINVSEIDSPNIKYIDGVFYIPAEVTGKFEIEYFIMKSDYDWDYPDDHIKIIDGNWNDWVMLVYSIFDVELSLNFKLNISDVRNDNFDLDYEPLDNNSIQFIIKDDYET